MAIDRITGAVNSQGGDPWTYEASWYLAGETAVWDAVLRRNGQVKGMLGGKVLLGADLPDTNARIEAFVRDALAHDIASRE
jgi:hypothetical protein